MFYVYLYSGALHHAPIAKPGLLVNAWDPWSMVGNGNAGDNSLDGFFGRHGRWENIEIAGNMGKYGKIGENGKSLIWMNA